MANGNDSIGCAITSMIVAALAGLVVAALLVMIGEWSYLQAGFAGVVVAIILAFLLTQFMCSEGTAKADLAAVREGKKGAAAVGAAAAAGASAAVATAAVSSAPAAASNATASAGTASAGSTTPSKAFEMQPSAPLSGEAELAGRKGDWKYEGDAAPAAKAKKPAAKKPAAKKAAAKSAGTKAASTKASSAKSSAAKADKPKRAAVAADGKPETLKKARSGGADDLKLISGVGPKLEGTLNEMGFWHFDQVAGWRKKEIEWVDSRLKFKGRIERDDWISQAKILAKGGETEFSKRKKT